MLRLVGRQFALQQVLGSSYDTEIFCLGQSLMKDHAITCAMRSRLGVEGVDHVVVARSYFGPAVACLLNACTHWNFHGILF